MNVTNGTVTRTLLSLLDATVATAHERKLQVAALSPTLIVGARGLEQALSGSGGPLAGKDDDFSFNPADYPSQAAHHQAVAEVMGLLLPHRSKQVPTGHMHLTSMSIRMRGRKGTTWVPFSKPLKVQLPDGSMSSTLYFEDACPAQYARMQRHALQRTRDFFGRANDPRVGMRVSLSTKRGDAHPSALVIDFGSPDDDHLHEFIHDDAGQNSRFICNGHIHTLDTGARGVDLRHPLNRMVVDISRNGNAFDLIRDIHRAMKDAWQMVHSQACFDVAQDLALEAGLGSFHYAHRAKASAEMTSFMRAKAGSNADIGRLADTEVVLTMEATEALHATDPNVISAQPGGVKLIRLIEQLKISMSKSSFTTRVLESWREAMDPRKLAEACKEFVLTMDADAPSLAMRIFGRSSHRLNATISQHLQPMQQALSSDGLATLHVPGAVLLACPENSSMNYSAEPGRRAAIGLESMRDAIGVSLSAAARDMLRQQSPRLLGSAFAGAHTALALAVSKHADKLERLQLECADFGSKISEFLSACAGDSRKPFLPSAAVLSNPRFMRHLLTGDEVFAVRLPTQEQRSFVVDVEAARLIAKVVDELAGTRSANLAASKVVGLLLDQFPKYEGHDATVIAETITLEQTASEPEYQRPEVARRLQRHLRDCGLPACLELVAVQRHEFDLPEEGGSFPHMEALKSNVDNWVRYSSLRTPACESFIDRHVESRSDPRTSDVELIANLVFELKLPGDELLGALVSVPGLRPSSVRGSPRVLMTASINATNYGIHAKREFIEWNGAKWRETLVDGFGNCRHKVGQSDSLGMEMRAIHPGDVGEANDRSPCEVDRIQALLIHHWGHTGGTDGNEGIQLKAGSESNRFARSAALDLAVARVIEAAFKTCPAELLSIMGGLNPQVLDAAVALRETPLPHEAAKKALDTCLDTGSRMGLTALLASPSMHSPEVLEAVARKGTRAQLHDAFDCLMTAHGSIPDALHGPALAALTERKDPMLLGDGLRHGLRMGARDVQRYLAWHSLLTTPELDAEVRARAMQLEAMSHARDKTIENTARHATTTTSAAPTRRRGLGL